MHKCASCGEPTSPIMSFGEVALAGAFLRRDEIEGERKHPLSLVFCGSCFLLQVPERVVDSDLFGDYFYFSSATRTMRNHFKHYADEVVTRFRPQSVLEIGCNDGVLLNPLAEKGVRHLVGVDPSEKVTASITDPRIRVVNDYFGPGVIDEKFDVVLANNVWAHIEDINGATGAVSECLSDDGVFIFEVNRLDGLVADLQYDWVYHEHRYYYSLLAIDGLLERHGLEVFDMKFLGTHAGSARYYACRSGSRPVSSAVVAQRDREIWLGLGTVARMERFAREANNHRNRFMAMISDAKAAGKTIAGYGACGRTNTMLQFCGLDSSHIDYIVDDAPAKHGFLTPGSHIPIVTNSMLGNPDMLIVFAWSFLSEIQDRCSGYKGGTNHPAS